ncbi:MAG: hypothetical protein ABI477_15330, partial [Chryseolinea sp.]
SSTDTGNILIRKIGGWNQCVWKFGARRKANPNRASKKACILTRGSPDFVEGDLASMCSPFRSP